MLSCRPVHTSGVVALLAEGVDRNMSSASALMLASVALLAEGVDRNLDVPNKYGYQLVALLAEGVDRNNVQPIKQGQIWTSPSSRRAWIEMCRK